MKQIYKAIDGIDNELCYFYFDHESDKYTVVTVNVFVNDEKAIEYFMKHDGDWSNVSFRFGDMNKAMLLKNW